MVSYILDSLNSKPSTFFAVKLSPPLCSDHLFFNSSFCLSFKSIHVIILATLFYTETNFLIALGLTPVQVDSHLEPFNHPHATTPFVRIGAASMLFTWTTIFSVGMNNAFSFFGVGKGSSS
jgi:hypothetical protein